MVAGCDERQNGPPPKKLSDLEVAAMWVEYAKRRDIERRRETHEFTARMFARV